MDKLQALQEGGHQCAGKWVLVCKEAGPSMCGSGSWRCLCLGARMTGAVSPETGVSSQRTA